MKRTKRKKERQERRRRNKGRKEEEKKEKKKTKKKKKSGPAIAERLALTGSAVPAKVPPHVATSRDGTVRRRNT